MSSSSSSEPDGPAASAGTGGAGAHPARAPERFRRVEELFTAARERPAAERLAWLAAECHGDDELRREVEALLRSVDDARDFLESPPDPRLGRSIGRWRLLRRIGAGGMGVVYEAARADGAYEQRVALKILRSSLDSTEAVARFHLERQVLARLSHPGVARLLDGGTTEDGTPWLVMELVDGVRIDEWCDARELPIARRVELFGAVCAAAHYAHQNLVVHRDLKPSNLLVSEGGAVKLVDFGIAKVLEPDDDPTRTADRRLTPAYASPEVVLGGAITTATDVYSLGVILYELLSGARPYAARTDTPSALERAICHTIPPAASRAALSEEAARKRGCSAPELRRLLSGDLDAIVATALAKEPQRRYPSAEALGEDLRRFLAHEPVQARPPRSFERVALFARRNPVAALLALVALLLFVAGGTATMLGWIAARRSADDAHRQTQVTTKVNEVLVELLRSFEPESSTSGSPDSVPARLLAVRKRLDEGAMADDPLAESTLRAGLVSVWQRLEEPHEAIADARTAAQLCLRALDREDPRSKRALYTLGQTLGTAGYFAEGEAMLRESMRPEPRPGEEDWAFTVGLEGLAMLLIDEARWEEADASIRRCREIRVRLNGPKSTSVYSMDNVQGLALVERGDFAAAEPILRTNLERRQEKFKPPNRALSISLRNLGCALLGLKRFAEAERAFADSLAMREVIYGPEHPFYVNVIENQAELHRETGRLESAETIFRRVLEVRRAHYSPQHPDLALAIVNLGELLLRVGKLDEALPLLEEGRAMADSMHRAGHPLRERAASLVESARAAGATAAPAPASR